MATLSKIPSTPSDPAGKRTKSALILAGLNRAASPLKENIVI